MNIPQVIQVQQHYEQPEVTDIGAELAHLLSAYDLSRKIRPGMRIAIACGSRGICGAVQITAQVVREVKRLGGVPFLFPAIGSHGGATAEGQRDMLLGLGYTPEAVGDPIVSSMETVCIGRTELDTPVYIDKNALEADGVIVINRIKKHTDHHNRTESGLLKMMTIGMGKRDAAAMVHSYGSWGLAHIIPVNGRFVASSPQVNVIAGIALLENARGRLGRIEIVEPADIPQREVELMEMANRLYPWFPFSVCDVLVLRRGGKNISGTCMDTNMIGRFGVWGLDEPEHYYATGQAVPGPYPLIEKIALLDLTEESHGNALGMGQADVITKRFFEKIDYQATYINGRTCSFLDKVKTPLVAESDRSAIQIALDCLNGLLRLEGKKTEETVKLCVADSTLHGGRFLMSRALAETLSARTDIQLIGDYHPLQFDRAGNLVEPVLV